MFRGYRNHLINKNTSNPSITVLPQVSKCSKCSKLNPIVLSPASNNIHICYYCAQPFYIIKPN